MPNYAMFPSRNAYIVMSGTSCGNSPSDNAIRIVRQGHETVPKPVLNHN